MADRLRAPTRRCQCGPTAAVCADRSTDAGRFPGQVAFGHTRPMVSRLADDDDFDERLVLGDDAGTGEKRPWGAYVVLDDTPFAKVKRITVEPGERLSYQLHHKRAEHWFVVVGTAHVTLDDVVREVPTGQAIDIPLGTAHRVQNLGTERLVFIEVQQGDYFGEDDIVRLEDDYGRGD